MMKNVKPLDKLWALLSVDKNGNEGLIALNMSHLGPQVAVTGEFKLLELYKLEAKAGIKEADDAGMKIVIAEYTRKTTDPL